jgi:hypothetical protein
LLKYRHTRNPARPVTKKAAREITTIKPGPVSIGSAGIFASVAWVSERIVKVVDPLDDPKLRLVDCVCDTVVVESLDKAKEAVVVKIETVVDIEDVVKTGGMVVVVRNCSTIRISDTEKSRKLSRDQKSYGFIPPVVAAWNCELVTKMGPTCTRDVQFDGISEVGERVPIECKLVMGDGTVDTSIEFTKIFTLIPSYDIAREVGWATNQGSSGVSIQVSNGPTVSEA